MIQYAYGFTFVENLSMRVTLSCALFIVVSALSACTESASDRRARFAPDSQVQADVIRHVQNTYGLTLRPEDLEVSLNCTVMNSRCELAVLADASNAGVNQRFVLWPRYQLLGTQFTLIGLDDNFRTQMVQAPIEAYVARLLKKPDVPWVTIRVREYNDFVGIEPKLPTDLRALSSLTGAELMKQYGEGIGLNIFIYVLASPDKYEPRVRAGLQRLLADPVIQQLGHGVDVRWYFRKERLPGPNGEGSADDLVKDGAGKWLPDSGPDNTQAKWQLQIGGRAFGNDLDESLDALWARLDKQEPMLTQ